MKLNEKQMELMVSGCMCAAMAAALFVLWNVS